MQVYWFNGLNQYTYQSYEKVNCKSNKNTIHPNPLNGDPEKWIWQC
jgi:hypothetical protein